MAEENEQREELLARHVREMEEHHAKSAGLGKKKRAEAARREDEMRRRHGDELAALEERMAAFDVASDGEAGGERDTDGDDEARSDGDGACRTLDKRAEAAPAEAPTTSSSSSSRKKTRAQKRREQRAREAKEREARIEEEKARAGPSMREEELGRLQNILVPKGLRIHEIQADGHCLFRAVEDQLRVLAADAYDDGGDAGGIGAGRATLPTALSSAFSSSFMELRALVAGHMREHAEEYLPFIEDDLVGDDKLGAFGAYCDEMANTAKWGGELELQALADAISYRIEVYSAEMPMVCFGPDTRGGGDDINNDDGRILSSRPIRLCFQRHAFGLGEHYNSLLADLPR